MPIATVSTSPFCTSVPEIIDRVLARRQEFGSQTKYERMQRDLAKIETEWTTRRTKQRAERDELAAQLDREMLSPVIRNSVLTTVKTELQKRGRRYDGILCPTPLQLTSFGMDRGYSLWLDCDRRACSACCFPRASREANEVMRGFQALLGEDGMVWMKHFTHRAQGGAAANYASRTGYPAINIPQQDGGSWLVTAREPRNNRTASGSESEAVASLDDLLEPIFLCVPAYTKLLGRAVRVKGNKHLQAAMAADRETEKQAREAERRSWAGDRPPRVYGFRGTAMFNAVVEGYRLVRGRDRHGRITDFTCPKASDEPVVHAVFSDQVARLQPVTFHPSRR